MLVLFVQLLSKTAVIALNPVAGCCAMPGNLDAFANMLRKRSTELGTLLRHLRWEKPFIAGSFFL